MAKNPPTRPTSSTPLRPTAADFKSEPLVSKELPMPPQIDDHLAGPLLEPSSPGKAPAASPKPVSANEPTQPTAGAANEAGRSRLFRGTLAIQDGSVFLDTLGGPRMRVYLSATAPTGAAAV